jgi:hypothetical protein
MVGTDVELAGVGRLRENAGKVHGRVKGQCGLQSSGRGSIKGGASGAVGINWKRRIEEG